MARVSEAKKDEHRQRLLDAAAAEFATKGLAGARVDDISVAAGLAKGTIYNYFDSKEDVFTAVVAQWAEASARAREQVANEGSAADRLRGIFLADTDVIAEMEQFARTAWREILTASPEQIASLLPAWEALDAELVALIESGQQTGEFRTDQSAAALCRISLSLFNGLLLEHWLFPDTVALADVPLLAIDFFLAGARTNI